jgi:hypothetical protein
MKITKEPFFLRGTEPTHALKGTTRRRDIIYIKDGKILNAGTLSLQGT